MRKIIYTILLLTIACFLIAQTTYGSSKYKQAWYDATQETVHGSFAAFDTSSVILSKTATGKWWLKMYDITGILIFEIDSTGTITTGTIDSTSAYVEMFCVDSSVAISVADTSVWYQITNATNNLFTAGYLRSFTLSGDTLTCTRVSLAVSDKITMVIKNTNATQNPTIKNASLVFNHVGNQEVTK